LVLWVPWLDFPSYLQASHRHAAGSPRCLRHICAETYREGATGAQEALIMGKRLPPGEAERRAAERRRKTWAGETKKRYDTSNGFGNADRWTGTAKAFVNGDVVVALPVNETLALLGLSEMPANKAGLGRAYRKAVGAIHKQYGSDTAPGYAEAFQTIRDAYQRLGERFA
jgi:hypothetical protein